MISANSAQVVKETEVDDTSEILAPAAQVVPGVSLITPCP